MTSKTNRKKAGTRVPRLPVQLGVEGPMLLTLHLPAWNPQHDATVDERAQEKKEPSEVQAGSCVVVLDLD
ncbi:hypothetical protein [Haliangium sp. UPWRP_2]|uniref:hypothetical protein n=1 Tax=Haliangium sp. UPWRP_2 TaxID=1931276 RepID=UPI000B547CD3|nr:hypothetical protein [Haliangium sp. UPWRP_2]PSM30588.1 hypothetical protein BVG81_009750 [Haliangium sp. UPWRP_2]HNN94573.1 hypothetical protein [Pseudomonadota bacterium]